MRIKLVSTVPGEVNDGGAAKEMLHMIMSGCNIAAEVDAIDKDGDVMEGEEKRVWEQRMCERKVCTQLKSVVTLCPMEQAMLYQCPSDRASSGSIPEFIQCSAVMEGTEPLDFFYELFPEDLIEYIVLESNRYGQQYMDSHASYLKDHPRARAHQFKRKMFAPHDIRKVLGLIILHGDCEHAKCGKLLEYKMAIQHKQFPFNNEPG